MFVRMNCMILLFANSVISIVFVIQMHMNAAVVIRSLLIGLIC